MYFVIIIKFFIFTCIYIIQFIDIKYCNFGICNQQFHFIFNMQYSSVNKYVVTYFWINSNDSDYIFCRKINSRISTYLWIYEIIVKL